MPPLSRRSFLVGGAGLGFAGLGVDALLVEPRWVEPTWQRLVVPGLPAALDGIVIAQLTDVHLRTVHAAARRVSALLDQIKPDVVLLTGDIVESAAGMANLAAWLPEVQGGLGTFASLGNWELWGGLRAGPLGQAYARGGAQLLVNEAARVERGGATLQIVGLDDPSEGRPDPAGAMRQASSGGVDLWMAHAPGYADTLSQLDVARDLPRPALILSGHTHGGQVRTPFGAVVTPPGSGRFVQGWYDDAWAPLYVSRGIGASIVPVRLLCRPELAIFTLAGR
jgi:uncharacterized protein